jgi:hypothetical protein
LISELLSNLTIEEVEKMETDLKGGAATLSLTGIEQVLVVVPVNIFKLSSGLPDIDLCIKIRY